MATLLVEPFGGMAGDMFLAALLDLGDPRFELDDLRALADSLVPGEAELACEEVWRGSLSGRHLVVRTPESDSAPHRGFADLMRLVEATDGLGPAARERVRAVLWRIAVAEGRVHRCAPEEVHFHEVGAVDTLVDVAGAALALERLGIDAVAATPPLVGSGTVRCAHGEMPVPAPATAELLRGRVVRTGGGFERTTPTGAALLVELAGDAAAPASFVAERVGYGAGTRDPEEGPPNLLRVQLGRAGEGGARRGVEAWLLEVNLDDMTPEEVGHAVGAVRAAGALEAWTAPVQMKKDRPGVVLSALARAGDRRAIEAAVFRWTTTLGVRWTRVERTECARRTIEVEVAGVTVRVKVRERPVPGDAPELPADLAPEHDDVARLAERAGWSLRGARGRAIEAALAALGGA